MLKALIRKQLLEIWQSYFINRKTGKPRSKKGIVLFFLLLVILFFGLGFVFYILAASIGRVTLGLGLNWLYFALMGLLSMALGVFGTVFNTYAIVYLPKDNEQLLALPIPEKVLLFSRLVGVYSTSLMYSVWVWIPTIIAYWVLVPTNVLNVLYPILMIFVITLFVTILSCVLGWFVALVASKVKGKSFITLFISVAIFVLYYFVYFKIVGSFGEILSHINEISDVVKSWLHYSYLLGNASNGDTISMLLIAIITSILFGICFFVLLKSFTKLSLVDNNSNTKRKEIISKDYTKHSIKKALINREYKHFTSVSTWMLNGGFGLLLLPVMAIIFFVKRTLINEVLVEISIEIPELYSLLPLLFTIAICFVLSTNAILPVSISMEGKSLWQIQSLPIDEWTVLRAKEKMSIQLNMYPAIISVLICSLVLRFNWLQTIFICLIIYFFVWISSDFGLFLNLKAPNVNWTNVASITKQSMPVVISVFGGWAFCIIVGIGAFFLSKIVNMWIVLCTMIVLFLILWLMLHFWLKKKGTKIFASL